MTTRAADRALGVGYALLLAATLVVSLGWLVVGALVAVATYSTSVADALTVRAAALMMASPARWDNDSRFERRFRSD